MFVAVIALEINRTAHRGERAVPAAQLAVDQVFALLDLSVEAVFFRDVADRREQVAKDVCCGHVATPC
ncbi:hypothetical protein D3C81_1632260 [compost metagenome]